MTAKFLNAAATTRYFIGNDIAQAFVRHTDYSPTEAKIRKPFGVFAE
jgi:hypothetical protein